MANLQTIPVYISVARSAFVNAGNPASIDVKPVLFVGNESIFACHLIDGAGQPVALPSDTEFYASLDSVYGPGSNDLVAVADDKFNIAEDWADIDLAAGKFCFRLTTAAQAIIDAMAENSGMDVHLEAWFREPGGNYSILLHETLRLRNVTADFVPVSTPEIPGNSVPAFADLPADPEAGDTYFVESLDYPVYWSGTRETWLNSMGEEVTADDE